MSSQDHAKQRLLRSATKRSLGYVGRKASSLVLPQRPPGRYFSETMRSCFGMDTRQVSVGASTDFVRCLAPFPTEVDMDAVTDQLRFPL